MAAGEHLAEAGADWIDVGGESTRPGAAPISDDEEKSRVVPVVQALQARLNRRCRISVDTYKASTAVAALKAGADVINDISGGCLEPDILRVTAQAQAAIVLGHMRGRPATMMDDVRFVDVVTEVAAELSERVAAARAVGCREILVDPGIGFGKRLEHNLLLLRHLPALCARVGVPVMVGVSRKRFIGDLTGRSVGERLFGTAAAVSAAILGGAAAVRVHDVAAMRDVVRVASAIASPDHA